MLNTTGTASQTTGAVSAANLLLLGSGGSYGLIDANDVGTLAANVGTGTINFNNGSNNLSIGSVNGTIGVTAGTLQLTDTGTVTQTGALSATNLDLLGSGASYTLSGPTTGSNTIGTLAASVGTGSVNLNDGGNALSIGTVNGTVGVTAGTLQLTDTGTVTQTGALVVTNLALLGSGATYTLSGPTTGSNNISTLSASVGAGNVTLDNGSNNLSIGTVNGTSGVTAGTLQLTDTGTVTQTGAVAAANVDLLGANATYALSGPAIGSNNVGMLAASVGTGSVNLNNGSNALSIGTVNGTTGVTAGTLQLTDTGTVTQTEAITVTNLDLLGSGGSYTFSGSGSNSVATLAASVGTGRISLDDGSNNLSIGSVNGTVGVTAGTLTLSDTGTVTQTGAVAATDLVLLGSGATYTLSGPSTGSNNVGTLAADVGSGAVNFNNGAHNLVIDTVNVTVGVNAGTLTLTDAGTVTQNQPVTVSDLELLGTGGNFYLQNGSNSVGTLAVNTANVALTNSISLTIGTAGGSTGLTASGIVSLEVSGPISDPTAPVSVAGFIMSGGSWSQIGTLPTFSATNDFELNNGATFLRVAGGDGLSTSTPYQITDIYGLQGMGGFVGSNFTLVNTIDATSTATWNGGAGFAPIELAGDFNGQNYVINKLNINLPSNTEVGLFLNSNPSGSIENVGLTNVSITGASDVGALVSYNQGPIANSYVTGTVTGATSGGYVGGLVAINDGNITSSYSTAAVSGNYYVGGLVGFDESNSNITLSYTGGSVTGIGSGSEMIGGLIGIFFNGSVSQSHSTATVSGYQDVGGLVGSQGSPYTPVPTLTNTYATGSVTGTSWVGGLVGSSSAPISQSNASGQVTGVEYVGGLVGETSSTISQSYATGAVTGNGTAPQYIGGLAGYNDIGSTIQNSYATGSVTGGTSGDFIGGLVGTNDGTITLSYATGAASGNQDVGGLVGDEGYSNPSASISQSYATGAVTGLGTSEGTFQGGGYLGGLMGFSGDGLVSQSYATGAVSGAFQAAGGLAGAVQQSSVSQVFATGAVTGSYDIGGLIGQLGGSSGPTKVTDAYALGSVTVNGAVNGGSEGGGLIGEIDSGGSAAATTVTNTYSIGYVSAINGGTTLGGLIGDHASGSHVTVSKSYWNTDTNTAGLASLGTGSATGITITQDTTSTLQTALPSGFNSGSNSSCTSCWQIVANQTYPYFTWRYSTSPQVISGKAYSDFGVTALAGGAVTELVSNAPPAATGLTATTGLNGAYYILLPAGTIASANSQNQVLVYSSGGAAFAQNATSSVTGLNIYGTFLNEMTASTNVSGITGLSSVDGGVQSFVNSLPNLAITPTGTSFTVDQAINTGIFALAPTTTAMVLGSGSNVVLNQAGLNDITASTIVLGSPSSTGSITVSSAVTLPSTVTSIKLITGASGGITVASGASLTDANAGGTITLNANSLSFASATTSNVEETGSNGTVAILPLTATTTMGLANSGSTLNLPATIFSNGEITATTLTLGGTGDSGAITVGGNVTLPTGTPTSGSGITNLSLATSGTITIAASTTLNDPNANGTVTLQANGLTFSNTSSSKVQESGSGGVVDIFPVTATTTMSIAGSNTLNLPATVFSNSEITAATLVYGNTADSGALAVSASTTLTSSITNLDLITSGTITISAGSTLTDTNANSTVLLQANTVTFSNTSTSKVAENATSGTVQIYPVTATRTMSLSGSAQLNLPSTVFSNSEITAGTLIFGNAADNGGLSVSNTTASPTLKSGVITNLQLINNSITINAGTTLADQSSGGAVTLTANTLTFANTTTSKVQTTSGTVQILPVTLGETMSLAGSGQLNLPSTVFSNSEITATTLVFGSTADTGGITVGGSIAAPSTITSLSLISGGAIVVNAALTDSNASDTITLQGSGLTLGASVTTNSSTGTVVLNSAGTASQSAGTITAAKLLLLGTGGSYTLTDSNAVGSLAANTGTIDVNNGTNLSTGSINGTTGVTGSGPITLTVTGNLTIASGDLVSSSGSNNDVMLSATGNFINNAGNSAVSVAGGGVWLIYSNTPGSDTFGSLNSGDTAIWGATYTSLPPSNVTASGDRYIFAFQPTLTFTTTNLNKTYGTDDSAAIASAYTVSGLQSGITNVFLGDTLANVYSGAPTVTSNGSIQTATVVAPGPTYAITIAQNTVTSLDNYALAFVSSGTLTVTTAPLTITAGDQSKQYGTVASLGTTSFSESGLVTSNGDAITAVTLTSPGTVASATVLGGPYAITPSAAVGSGLSNYSISYVNAPTGLTVTTAPLTITAGDQSKQYGTVASLGTTSFSESGLVTSNGDAITAVTLTSPGTVASATVLGGPYAITPSAAVGSGLSNYSISYVNAPTGLTVTTAPLTITAGDQSKQYGTVASLGTTSFSESGLVTSNGDAITAVTLTSPGTVASATVLGGPYAITPSAAVGSGLSNYSISYVNAPTGLTVTTAPLTITAGDQSKQYGTVASLGTTSFSESGLVTSNGDAITAVTLTSPGTVASATVLGGPYAITPSAAVGSGLSNYSISYVNAPTGLTVTTAPLTITAGDQSKQYGTVASLGTTSFSESGLVTSNGDAITAVTLTSPGTVASATVLGGPYAITPSAAVGSGLSNYSISYVNAPTGLTVTTAPLTITAGDQSKQYGTVASLGTTSFSESGLVTSNGDAITAVTLTSPGTVASATVLGGPYAITPSAAVGSGLSNYSISYVNAPTGLTVTTAPLTITAGDQSKQYGTVASLGTTSFSESGLVTSNGDAITAVTLTSPGTVASATVLGGPYAITPSAAVGSGLSNYSISYVNAPTGLTVTTAPLTITAGDQSKQYGTVASLGTTSFSESGLVTSNGDAITAVTLTSPGTVASATVLGGPYAITPSAAVGSGLSNYSISYVNAPTGLTVTTAPLTITAGDQSKQYGTVASLGTTSFSESGLVTSNGDAITAVTLTSPGTVASATVLGGPYAITPSAAVGSGLSNYSISYVNAPTGLTVTTAPLTITAGDQSKQYGTVASLGTTSFSESGLVTSNGDAITAVTLTSPGTVASATVLGGPYAITPSAAVGSGLSNYSISYVNAPTGLTVTTAPLTITAGDQSKQYGTVASLGTTSFSESGLVTSNGDAITAVTLTSPGTVASATVLGGPYAITPSAAVGSGLSNYSISYVNAPTGLTVTTAPLTITAGDQSKQYGTVASLGTTSFSESGLVTSNGDAITAVTLTSPGTVASATVLGGPYAITPSAAVGSGLSNYSISYVNAPTGLTVTTAPLTITAGDQSKQYGTVASLGTTSFSESGLVTSNGDAITAVTLTSPGTVASATVLGGPYAITPSAAVGSGLSNYSISYVNAPTGLTVTTAPLTITANAETKIYGTNDPTLAYTIGGSGLLNGDSLTGALSRPISLSTEQVGSYAISQGTLAASSNYTLSYVGANLTITAASATATANAQSKTYGTNDPALTYSATGLVNGIVDGVAINDSLTGSLTRAQFSTLAGEQVGSYAISQGTLAASSNYTLSYVGANLTITAASATATANAQSKTYGTNDPALTYSATGLVNGIVDGVAINDSLTGSLTRAQFGTLAGEQVGSYAISQGTLAATPNYTLSYTGANLTITPATITYVADHPVIVNYGTALPAFNGTVTGVVNAVVDGVAINDNLGTAQFTTTATGASPIGFYAINGSGLTANANYNNFQQASTNATALQIGPALPGQYLPSTPPVSPPTNTVTISFQNNGNTPFHVSFTPNGPFASNQGNNVSPGALPPGDALSHNNGFDFQPISEYDANQYADFKLPDYDNDDSEAAIFTILARAASPGHGADYMIDSFWSSTGATWPGAGNIKLSDKVTFSDGAGRDVTPADGNAFPIVPGKTDFAQLLKSGPVMIGGPAGQTPAQWLLATGLTPDGKDIICDDPVTGKQIELAYNSATETVGGITGIYDAKTKGFVSLADASGSLPDGTSAATELQNFVASTYYAVAMH